MSSWTVRLEGGPRRVNHAAVVYNDKIYSFGGYCSGDDYEQTRPMDVHVLDTYTYRWKALTVAATDTEQFSQTPYQRYGHTAILYCRYAYIWGGRNDSEGACDKLYEFDCETLCWRKVTTYGQTPARRDGHSSCIINDQMYIFGGFEEEFDRFSNEVFSIDLKTMKWREIVTWGIPPLWRDFHTAVAIGSKMFIFGGRSDALGQFHTNREVYSDKLKYLDTRFNVWVEQPNIGSKPIGRRSHSAFIYKDCLYIFGGYNGLERKHYSDLWKFDPVLGSWNEITPIGLGPEARRRQCCIIHKDRLFLFGGTSPRDRYIGTASQDSLIVEPDLIDHSDLYVLDFAPNLKTLTMLAVLKFNLPMDSLPLDVRWDILAVTKPNRITTASRNENSHG